MNKLSCLRAGSLIAARASGLSRADGLWLEEHVHGCDDCAAEAELMTAVRSTLQSVPAELPIEARNRAIRNALHAHRGTASSTRRAPIRPAVLGLSFAGALALAAAALIAWPRDPGAASAPSARTLSSAPSAGDALIVSEAEKLQAGARVHTDAAIRVALAHADVGLAAKSDAQWNAAARELTLREGELNADVDPARHQSFVVITRDFRVEVLGTRFAVTQTSVSVTRGRVRIVSLDGSERAVLGAGERYDVESATAEETQDPSAPKRAEVKPLVTNVPALLTEARDALAADRLEHARRAIDRALAAKPSGAARAEALTLRAELLVAQGDRGGALAAYLEVASRFQRLPAGENALFAAARIHGDATAAKKLLQQYLERYPNGRFVVEAKYRLQR
jgi:ferric-dicitrate binding protein FerR (iron transport regulator)